MKRAMEVCSSPQLQLLILTLYCKQMVATQALRKLIKLIIGAVVLIRSQVTYLLNNWCCFPQLVRWSSCPQLQGPRQPLGSLSRLPKTLLVRKCDSPVGVHSLSPTDDRQHALCVLLSPKAHGVTRTWAHAHAVHRRPCVAHLRNISVLRGSLQSCQAVAPRDTLASLSCSENKSAHCPGGRAQCPRTRLLCACSGNLV